MKQLDVVRVKLKKEFQLNSLGKISNPKDAVKLAADYFSECSQEVFGVCCLSAKGDVLNITMIGQGTVNVSLVDLRTAFQSILLSNAAGIVCIHNHTSGDSSPSREDFEITEKIKTICKIMGCQFLDHIIVGGRDYYSFLEGHKLDEINELSFPDLIDWCDVNKETKREEYLDYDL